MKKHISLLLIIFLLASVFILSGCNKEEEESLSDIIEEKVVAYETDIKDTIDNVDTNEEMADYIYNWGKTKGIKTSKDSYNNIVMTIKPSEKLKKNHPTVIQCNFDETSLESSVTPIATCFFIAKNIEETGPLKILFTSSKNNNLTGINKVDKNIFKNNTKVISLGYNTSQVITKKTGSYSDYTLSHGINTVSLKNPKNKVAYKISIDNLPGGIPNSKISSYPNPIKELGDLLAYLKTNSLIFQLSTIHGGESASTYPKDATMTIVIDKDYEEKLVSKLDTAIDTFNDNYENDDEEEYTYKYEVIKTPSKVYSIKTTDGIIGFLYTLLDGVYYKDDSGKVLAISNVGSLHKKDNRHIVEVSALSLEDELSDEIKTSLKTIASLNNGKFKENNHLNNWVGLEESSFMTKFNLAYRTYSGKTAEFEDYLPLQSTSIINKINPKMDMLYIATTEKTKFKYTGTLYEYLGEPDK